MSLAERERHQRCEQLQRARYKLEEHHMPRGEQTEADLARGEEGWQDLVERRIQQAMAAGAFDNLPGAGKPLNLSRYPYLDPSVELAYGLLKNNGYVPEWIAWDKEVRQELEAARARLGAAWRQRQADQADEVTWQAAVRRFDMTLANINKKIDDFNLIVPISNCQRVRLHLEDELRRLNHE